MKNSENKLRYRLGLDLGTTSLGWAMIRLDSENRPCAVIRAGVRIFSDGRTPKTQESLAVARRLARQMRRTRDRTIRRKNRLINDLVELGFFPTDEIERRALQTLDPYALRAKGLYEKLEPAEFARAIFHLAQRRGYQSNRKTDSAISDAGKMKKSIKETKLLLEKDGCQTVGEWLNKRHQKKEPVLCRMRKKLIVDANGKEKNADVYDLYLERSMIYHEFNLLWEKQAAMNPELFSKAAHDRLESTIFFQRKLRPVKAGRCTLIPELERAPLALPSQQRFRIYQEVNNLRKLGDCLDGYNGMLTIFERDKIVAELEKKSKVTFAAIKKLIGYVGDFNLEDDRRTELKGNATSSLLSKKEFFGNAWFDFASSEQDEIVERLISVESEQELCGWLTQTFGISDETAARISEAPLQTGYGSLSKQALERILPFLKTSVITYSQAVVDAGFKSHSALSALEPGETLDNLPYYGEYLQRHVGFGTGNPEDPAEIRFGKIANPTVHIGLNQTKVVVNALIKKYGKPAEIVIEVARDLKNSKKKKDEIKSKQAENQKTRNRIRKDIANARCCEESEVTRRDIEKWMLWEELNRADALARMCPYSGKRISAEMLMNGAAEIEHILPYSRTLDDSMANKTVSLREANRIKGNMTPWEAKEAFEREGWSYDDILARAERMPKNKRFRFGKDGYESWLQDEDFVARALTDTAYLSRIAREYLSLICCETRCIPGGMTAKLRKQFGLNTILSNDGNKNRNDHRHHAVDACVIGITDRSLLQRVATVSAKAKEHSVEDFMKNLTPPWLGYRDSVDRAIAAIKVSHRPDHSFEGCFCEDTAWGPLPDGSAQCHKIDGNGQRNKEIKNRSIIKFTSKKGTWRHGINSDGSLKEYKGYVGGSNYCIEILLSENGKWVGKTISTYNAYQVAQKRKDDLLNSKTSCTSNLPLIMKLRQNDCVQITENNTKTLLRINAIKQTGEIVLYPINEANCSERTRSGDIKLTSKRAGSLQNSSAHFVTISPIGDVKFHK